MLSNGAKICSIKSRTHTRHVDDAEQFSSSDLSFFKGKRNHSGWSELRGFTEETRIYLELYRFGRIGQRGVGEKHILKTLATP